MTSQSAATRRSRYVLQAATDLEENRRRQRDLAEEIERLEQEEAILLELLALAERYEGLSEPSALPEQAQGEPGPAGPRAGGKPRQPLLTDLLLDLLRGHTGPRSAKDLRAELMRDHPDREPTPQVVRNTLEALVAKGRIRRQKLDRSVAYTLLGD
ncbi:hypothetical protein ACFQ6N_18055 [Kitasatospora sp. NPDC056446]|uniref:hypothetical protein n=1 Tax=Kitasatospora sp. NPDC056446 TaxID=3345819 RepID=UPI0036B0C481